MVISQHRCRQRTRPREPSQGGDTGSNPVGTTKGNRSFWIDVTTSFKVQTRASDQRETAARRALLGAPTAGRPTSLPTATSRGPFPTEIACRPYGRLVDLRR